MDHVEDDRRGQHPQRKYDDGLVDRVAEKSGLGFHALLRVMPTP
jgi:hypothetical protein